MSSVSLALEFINLGMQSQLQQSSLRESVRGWQPFFLQENLPLVPGCWSVQQCGAEPEMIPGQSLASICQRC